MGDFVDGDEHGDDDDGKGGGDDVQKLGMTLPGGSHTHLGLSLPRSVGLVFAGPLVITSIGQSIIQSVWQEGV